MLNTIYLRQATIADLPNIWDIIQQAILKRKNEGSDQWQDGYPNLEIIQEDISNGFGYIIVTEENNIIGYVAIINEVEPAYTAIEGKWLNDEEYLVIHRLAVAQNIVIKGLGTWTMQEIEKIALVKNIHSIKVDTNFDNTAMLRVFDKLGYIYCGEVNFGGGIRKAFQKIL